jgi:hypothetical protein
MIPASGPVEPASGVAAMMQASPGGTQTNPLVVPSMLVSCKQEKVTSQTDESAPQFRPQ